MANVIVYAVTSAVFGALFAYVASEGNEFMAGAFCTAMWIELIALLDAVMDWRRERRGS